MFWDIFYAVVTGCVAILSIPFDFGGLKVSLWMVFLGGIVISLVGRLIWGVLD